MPLLLLLLPTRKRGDPGQGAHRLRQRLAGPAERAERLASLRSRSTLVAGVLVPPQPDEPDNCCMSGCVNCVWDRYREEMETWSAVKAEAQKRLRAQPRRAGRDGRRRCCGHG